VVYNRCSPQRLSIDRVGNPLGLPVKSRVRTNTLRPRFCRLAADFSVDWVSLNVSQTGESSGDTGLRAWDGRTLGRTGLEVTVAGYGGGSVGNFGRVLSNRQAERILDAAWAAGIRYFDTAPFYGRGRSERRIGAFLSEKSRAEFVLSTKVGRLLDPAPDGAEDDGLFLEPAPFNPRWDYSYDGVMRSYADSLQRLGLDRIDILYVHDIGRRLHGEAAAAQLEILKHGGVRALEKLRSEGAIRGYGLGVTEIDVCLDCLDYADPDAFLLAGRYTLLAQTEASPLLEACVKREVSLVIGGIFASGILATGAIAGARYDYAPAPPDILERVRRLDQLCRDHATSLSAAALQFPLAHPVVASVLLGAGSVKSLQQCLAGLAAPVSDRLWQALGDET
jgi:D-threo-aldose 1-dehydrogenase